MEEKQIYVLSYSVRGRVVLKYFGQLCIVLAALPLVTLAVSIFYGEYMFILPYSGVMLFIGVTGILLSRIKAPSNIQANESLVITGLIFLFSSLILSYPMTVAGLPFEDAFFESVSAFTTTGLSTLKTVEDKSQTFLFSRAWMQWSGGLGIIVLSVALLIRPGIEAKRLVDIEKSEDFVGGTRSYALKVLKIYSLLTVIGIIVLILMGVDGFQAIVHTFAAVSTGGFSSYDNSLLGLGSWAPQFAVSIISLTGALSLILFYRTYRKGWKTFCKDLEVKALFISVLIVMLLLLLIMRFKMGIPLLESLRNAPLLALSAQTTAGFSPLNVTGLDPAAKLILSVSMIVGGCIGSTAGGFKIFRLLVLIKVMKLALVRTSQPEHAVMEPKLSGQKIGDEEIQRAMLIILFFILTVLVSWIPFIIMGYEPIDALFEVISAVGTVGLSSGITSSDLPALLKGILCADMLMGRLEIIALLIILYPRTWVGRRFKST
jgi:trk system potassium uptake protein TrkH